MFHLTPQEKSALAGLLTVCLVGSCVHVGLCRNFRPLTWAATTAQKPKIHPPDLNTATAPMLHKVPGIGLKTAQNIVEYRSEHGAFLSLEELLKVKGITQKNFPKIKKYYQQAAKS